MKILCVGDVVGAAGRRGVKEILPRLVDAHKADFVIVNAENAAGGIGTNKATADELFSLGADVLTGGNHTWRHKDYVKVLQENPRALRPLNFPEGTPGNGYVVAETAGGHKIAVVNAMGRIFMDPLPNPFEVLPPVIQTIRQQTNVIIVDFHAEATSEKRAMGWHLDGTVSAVFGTHTHVPTADEEILPEGTAYVTDIGMTGPYDSVIGMKKNRVLKRFVTQRPVSFEPAKHDVRLCGIVLEIDDSTGKAQSITRLRETIA